MLNPQDVIRHKRNGGELSREEIEFFARGVVSGEFADYQASALLMAIYWRGMTEGEQAALTQAMLRSGAVLDFSDIDKPKADKHSTGGVGDKTSLLIAPIRRRCASSTVFRPSLRRGRHWSVFRRVVRKFSDCVTLKDGQCTRSRIISV